MSGFSAYFKGKHESKATKSTENELREERVQHRDYAKLLYLIKKYFLGKKNRSRHSLIELHVESHRK